jgi:cobalamin biosynthesis Mg chelatase CobN
MPDGTPTSNHVQSLSSIYTDLEMFLVRLMQNQARRQQQGAQNPQAPQSGAEGETSSQGFTPQAMAGTPAASAPTPTATASGGGAETPAPGSASDDSDSRKRKAEDDDDETKRAKFRKIEEVCLRFQRLHAELFTMNRTGQQSRQRQGL